MDVRGYIEANSGEYFAALKQWLAIPSASADPARRGDVRRSAQWLAARLRATGCPVAEDHIHAPNEQVSMALLLKGAEAAASLWDELAAAAPESTAGRAGPG